MESPILHLQELSRDSDHQLTDVLRQALAVATKLDLDDLQAWINFELEGYGQNQTPEYRNCKCQYFIKRPVIGLHKITMANSEAESQFCHLRIHESVQVLQHILDTTTPGGSIEYTMAPEVLNHFRRCVGDSCADIVRTIPVSTVAAILGSVRNALLRWSLTLEKQGILGAGTSFSIEEKKRAHQSQIINIGQFQGVLGDIWESHLGQEFMIERGQR